MIVEAGALFFFAGPRFSAGDEGEDLVEEGQCFPNGIGGGVGAEDFAASFAGVAGEHDPGEFFVGDDDVGIRLVVAEPDVVGGPVLFDEVAFEDEGFEFAVHYDPFDVADLVDHSGDPVAVVGGLVEIASDAGAQVDGLADIEDVADFVPVDVATGLLGDIFELVLDVGVREGHRSSE